MDNIQGYIDMFEKEFEAECAKHPVDRYPSRQELCETIREYRRRVMESKSLFDIFIDRRPFLDDCEEYAWISSVNRILYINGIPPATQWYEEHEPIKSKLGLNCYKYYKRLERLLKEKYE